MTGPGMSRSRWFPIGVSLSVQNHSRDFRYCADRPSRWCNGLPVLSDERVTLREPRASDVESLFAQVRNPTVLQYIAAAPASVEGFGRFIRWTRVQRRNGRHLCFGIVPRGATAAVGVIQIWPIEPDFSTAEWGFFVGEPFWGTGLFVAAAELMLDFAFGSLGVIRLEARAVDANGRGNGILRKLGASCEGSLRSAFRDGLHHKDHVMWSILADEWIRRRQRRRSIS